MAPKLAVFLVSALGISACAEEAKPDPHADLVTFIKDEMIAGGLAGLGAAAVDVDPGAAPAAEPRWVGSFGSADIDARRAVDDRTSFLVASLSKTVVSVLLMQLVEEGRVDLDEPIDNKIGFAVRHPAAPDRPITPRMLATHTSGLIDDWIALAKETTIGDAERTLHEFAHDYVVPEHFGSLPGEAKSYSNAGFAILGAFVEAAAGEPLPELSRRKIFDPLGMNDTGWLLREMELDRIAIPYSGTIQEGPVASEHQGFSFFPATSLRTSARDLARFLGALIADGRGPNGALILSEDSVRTLRAPQIPTIDGNQAIGFYYEEIDGIRYLGHSGLALGASALMFAREDGVGLIVLSNSDAFLRARFGMFEGSDAMYRIIGRLAAEAW